jgi:glycogen(starch) synthase
MRILMLGWELPPRFAGGVGVVTHALLRALARRGHELVYAMPAFSGEAGLDAVRMLGPEASAAPSRLASYASAAPPIRVPGEVAPPSGDPLYGADLLAEIGRFADDVVARVRSAGVEFDVVHAQDWTTFRAGLALARTFGKPWIAHVHITEFDKSGGSHADPAVYAAEREGICGADLVVAVSQRIAATCRERYGADARRVRVIYNGIDFDTSSPMPPALPRPLVLFLGRVTLQKGPEYFLEAAARALTLEPDAHFVLAGTGDMLPRMIERAAELGIAEHVSFPGFVDRERASALYAAADVFVMPSVSEPFGIVPLEAMDRRVPVIVSRQSGVSEVLRHALKVDFWDVEDLAAKIVAALRMPALAEELRRNALTEIATMSWDAVAGRLEHLYEELLRA